MAETYDDSTGAQEALGESGGDRLVKPWDAASTEADRLQGLRSGLGALLVRAGLEDELAKIGALWTPPDDSSLALADRVWSGPALATRPEVSRVGSTPYRLRGPALYDAWGREFLFSQGAENAWRMHSAGRDGCLVFAPGSQAGYQSAANADAPAAGDADGSLDNLHSAGDG